MEGGNGGVRTHRTPSARGTALNVLKENEAVKFHGVWMGNGFKLTTVLRQKQNRCCQNLDDS